ncbi:hypothetical protein F4556_003172 [Kitasatospora gansuensis]|uniref:Chaplin domain-containing protein n=2 Tax=Kitasatospora TaxID=2063 RepID=A0A7W7WHC7_9ACTN|nr:hypothetical protein [Kitasatospora gansuensis]MBB4947637.1 hypothetical protein [Kitasatospora gansuensis]
MRKITALAALTMAGLALASPAAHADNNMGGKLSSDHPVGAAGTCVEQLGSIPLVGKQASAATPVCGAYAVVPRG